MNQTPAYAPYSSRAEAAAATMHLRVAEVAEQFGISAKAVRDWRGLVEPDSALTDDLIRRTADRPAGDIASAHRVPILHIRERRVELGLPVEPATGQPVHIPPIHKRRIHSAPNVVKKLRDLGYDTVEDAVHDTAQLSMTAAGRKLGVGYDTVQRWRLFLGLEQLQELAPETVAKLRERGYDNYRDAAIATAHLGTDAAQVQLGVDAATVIRWRAATGIQAPPRSGADILDRLADLGLSSQAEANRATRRLSKQAAADRLGVSPSTVDSWRRSA